MLLIIIWYFFIIIFHLGLDLIVLALASELWSRPRSFDLGLGLEVLALFNITGDSFIKT